MESLPKSQFGTKVGTDVILNIPTGTLQPCHLFNLPNELLAELAAWLSHPVDLLSLALTSKYHYKRLTGPKSSLLWRRTRAAFRPEPVPDPPSNLTEIAWAQFLFGLNYCGGCGRKTYDLPFSFALRLHLCRTCSALKKVKASGMFSSLQELVEETRTFLGAQNASMEGPDNLLLLTFVYWATPRLEHQRSRAYWPTGDYLLSQDLMEHSTKAWRSAIGAFSLTSDPGTALIETIKKLALRKRCGVDSEKVAEKLLEWSMLSQNVLDANESHVVDGAKIWAKERNLDYDDLERSQKFRELCTITKRRRLPCMVPLLNENHADLVSQTRRIHTSRAQSAQAVALIKRQREMEQYYRKNIASQEYHPSFRVFRSLPVVKSLIQNTSGDDIRRDLKTEAIRSLIKAEVKRWMDRAAQDVRLLLGYNNGSSKSGKGKQSATLSWEEYAADVLAPEKRCTSLFVCVQCKNVAGPYKRAGVMDFKGLSLHECNEKHKSRKERVYWAIANFELAHKAQCVVGMMAELECLEKEKTPSSFLFDLTQENERRWICGNCAIEPMSRQDLVRHCQRHEEQKVSLSSQESAYTMYQKRAFSFAELSSGCFPEETRRKQFECVHCRQPGGQPVPRTVMDFNGLRCHLKAKHGILDVRNEDIGLRVEVEMDNEIPN